MISNFVLIIGAMKSGTTTLYDYLARHPRIAAGLEKEPGFFSSEESWARGLDWYESQFGYDPRRHCFALDGSTDYTKWPFCTDVTERLKASAPRRFKLIYIMRHPLRRIESHALHAELTKTEIGRQISRRKSHSFDAGISPAAIAFSLYANQIDKYSEYYDKGELLLLTLEQLTRDPDRALDKVYKFLELDKVARPNSPLTSNSAASHYLPHPIWYSLYRIAPLHAVVRTILPKTIRQYIYDIATFVARPSGRFILNADEERVVMTLLAPDLTRLRDRYNIDVEKEWGIVL